MNPERFEQVDSILQSALDLPAERRDSFLRHACAGDESLEREVRSLLASRERAAEFLEKPAIDVGGQDIARKQTNRAALRSPTENYGPQVGGEASQLPKRRWNWSVDAPSEYIGRLRAAAQSSAKVSKIPQCGGTLGNDLRSLF